MTLQATVPSLDAVPEPLRDHYEPLESGDGFRLSVEKTGGFALVNEEGAVSAAQAARRDAAEAAKRERDAREALAAFGDLKPAEVRDALGRLEKLEKNPPKADATDVEAIKRELLEREVKPLKEAWETEKAGLSGRVDLLTRSFVEGEIRRVLADPELDGSFALVGAAMASRVKAEVTDKGVKLTVLGADGSPSMGLDADGNPADTSLRDLAEQFAKDREYAPAFRARSSSPHGVNGSNAAGGRTDNPFKTGNLTAQMELERANPAEARRLAAEAGAK